VAVREFIGPSIGLRRRSVAYDTVTWLLPASAIVDVPLALEFDALASVGRDYVIDASAAHADVWVGRLWLPGRQSLLVADAWGSGYRAGGVWSAATVRAALNYERAAHRGVWSARAGFERWLNPDPDLSVLVNADPTYRALGDNARHATTALTASLERSVHAHRLTRSYTLDVAAFGAASTRDSARIAVLGVGLRLAPARLGRATARLDVGYPVVSSGDVKNRPFISIGITPWLEQDRLRDGRRAR
jgi:hypothetical protein